MNLGDREENKTVEFVTLLGTELCLVLCVFLINRLFFSSVTNRYNYFINHGIMHKGF